MTPTKRIARPQRPLARHFYVDCWRLEEDGGDLEPTRAGTDCQTCLWRMGQGARDRKRAAQKRQRAVRQPPRPPFEATPGVCSLCGGELPGRRSSWCSDSCVELWRIANHWSGAALSHLTETHGWGCWICHRTEVPGIYYTWTWVDDPILGPPSPVPIPLEVEHCRPLWALTEPERLELRWWLPFNLELLCQDCHRLKSAWESKERARRKREPGAVFQPWRPERFTDLSSILAAGLRGGQHGYATRLLLDDTPAPDVARLCSCTLDQVAWVLSTMQERPPYVRS